MILHLLFYYTSDLSIGSGQLRDEHHFTINTYLLLFRKLVSVKKERAFKRDSDEIKSYDESIV